MRRKTYHGVGLFPVTDINSMEPSIMATYRQVKSRQDDLEHRRKDADEKLAKLRDLIEQVSFMSLSHLNYETPSYLDHAVRLISVILGVSRRTQKREASCITFTRLLCAAFHVVLCFERVIPG